MVDYSYPFLKGYFRAAKACLLLGELSRARGHMERVAELDPDKSVTPEELKNLAALEKMYADLKEFIEKKDHTAALDTIKVES